ncbi:MAG: DALR domain-containing protein, partial [Pseudomonadota bacterium]
AALEDDLNFPRAIAELFRLAKAARRATSSEDRAVHKAALLEAGSLLGLLQQSPAAWFGSGGKDVQDEASIQRLVDARSAARAMDDYATADQLRDELLALGIAVEDKAGGPTWRRVRQPEPDLQ